MFERNRLIVYNPGGFV